MRVILIVEGKNIGFLDYEMLNSFELMGKLGNIITNPMQLARVIERKIKKNEGIVVSGGFRPDDLSNYFDGVVRVLESIKAEVREFDYLIPPEENPYLEDVPEEIQQKIH